MMAEGERLGSDRRGMRLQLLTAGSQAGRALEEYLEDDYELLDGTEPRSADGYLVDERTVRKHDAELRRLKRRDEAFRPVVLLRDGADSMPAALAGDGEEPPLVDEVVSPTAGRGTVRRRMRNLFARREESRRAVEGERDRSRWRRLFELTDEALLEVTGGGERLTACNPAACELSGYSEEELLDRSPTGTVFADDAAAFRSLLQRVRETGEGSDELACTTNEGETRRVAVSAAAIDAGGGPSVLLLVRDATGRDADEQELELKSEVMDKAPIGITISDPDRADNPLIYANDGYRELTGYAEEEVLGRNCRFLQGEETRPEPVARMRNAVDAGRAVSVELRNYREDGTQFWNRVSIAPIRDESGAVTNYVGFQEDVTDRKESQRSLERSRELLRHTERIADTGGWEFDLRTEELRWTRGTRRIHGVPQAYEPAVEVAVEFYHPDDRGTIEAAIEECRENGTPYEEELRLITADGEQRWVRTSGEAVTEDGEVVALRGAIQDITERKERDRERELFRKAVENAGHAVMITDRNGTIEYVNPAFEEQTGYTSSEATGLNPRILKSGKQPEAFYEELWGTILDGEMWHADIVNKRKSGELYRIEQGISPITNDAGEITHFVAIESDVTNQRLREQQLDVLNRILRHNLRNGTGVIKGNASLLAENLDDGRLEAYAEAIRRRAEDFEALSEKATTVRSIFEQGPPPDEGRSVGGLLDEVIEEFEARYPDADVTVARSAELSVRADGRLKLALSELVDNAIAHSDREEPTVEITATASENGYSEEWVDIAIADDGPGIPEHERNTIESGEETPLQHGSGLGLWSVYWTVSLFGGEVSIEDRTPRGTRVVLTLPRASVTDDGPDGSE